jgi:hypothetical protein
VDGGLLAANGRQSIGELHGGSRRACSLARRRERHGWHGFYATFDGPTRAIRCALEVAERVRDLGIGVRAGVHAGECVITEGKYGGVAYVILHCADVAHEYAQLAGLPDSPDVGSGVQISPTTRKPKSAARTYEVPAFDCPP